MPLTRSRAPRFNEHRVIAEMQTRGRFAKAIDVLRHLALCADDDSASRSMGKAEFRGDETARRRGQELLPASGSKAGEEFQVATTRSTAEIIHTKNSYQEFIPEKFS